MDKEEIIKDLRAELDSFFKSRSAFKFGFPRESALEYQHGLNHLCLAAFKKANSPERLLNIQKATGHIHRAHLDYLKVWLLETYKDLKKKEDPTILKLALSQGLLKLEELQSLGKSDRMEIFKNYRKLLHSFPAPSSSVSSQVETVEIGRKPISLEVFENVKAEYWEWAQLEAMSASLSGDRLYNNITEVIRGLERGNFAETVFKQLTVIYYHFVEILLRIPKTDEEANWLEVNISPLWKVCSGILKEYDECELYLLDYKKGKVIGSDSKYGSPEEAVKQFNESMGILHTRTKPIVQAIKEHFFTKNDLRFFDLPR